MASIFGDLGIGLPLSAAVTRLIGRRLPPGPQAPLLPSLVVWTRRRVFCAAEDCCSWLGFLLIRWEKMERISVISMSLPVACARFRFLAAASLLKCRVSLLQSALTVSHPKEGPTD